MAGAGGAPGSPGTPGRRGLEEQLEVRGGRVLACARVDEGGVASCGLRGGSSQGKL